MGRYLKLDDGGLGLAFIEFQCGLVDVWKFEVDQGVAPSACSLVFSCYVLSNLACSGVKEILLAVW